MATRTSVGSGLWSAPATWDTGVPLDGDDVVIGAGHVVTFDVDQSAFVTGVKVTITGTLTHTTASGNYCLFIKTGSSVIGSGTWNVGTQANPIPFDSKHTITGASGWYIVSSATFAMTIYGTEPTNKYLSLTTSQAIGDTVINVNTDVTGDLWRDGDTITIAREQHVIAAGGISANTITLVSGLSATKSAGELLCLTSRNVKFIANGQSIAINRNIPIYIGSGSFKGAASKVMFSSSAVVITGGVFYNSGGEVIYNVYNQSARDCVFTCNTGNTIRYCNGWTYTNVVFSGNGNGLTGGSKCLVTNCLFYSFSGEAVTGSFDIFIGCDFRFNLGSVVSSPYLYSLYQCTFSDNGGIHFYSPFQIYLKDVTSVRTSGYHFRQPTGVGVNVTLTGGGEMSFPQGMDPKNNFQINDYNGVSGAKKAWCYQGTITSQSSVIPVGYSEALLFVLGNATGVYKHTFWKEKFVVPRGMSFSIECHLRKSASMSYLPRIVISKNEDNPMVLYDPAASFVMTDSIDTWESTTLTIDNSSGVYDNNYTLYILSNAPSGNVYSAYKIEPVGTGGSVKILPISGKVGL